MSVLAKLRLVELERELARLRHERDRAFNALVRAEVGTPTWRARNLDLESLDVEITGVVARMNTTPSARGVRSAYRASTVVVTLSLSAEDREHLDARARQAGLSRSAFVRRWIRGEGRGA